MSRPKFAHRINIPEPWVPAASTDIRKRIARELRRLADLKRAQEADAEAKRLAEIEEQRALDEEAARVLSRRRISGRAK